MNDFDYKQRPTTIDPKAWAIRYAHATGREHDPNTCPLCKAAKAIRHDIPTIHLKKRTR